MFYEMLLGTLLLALAVSTGVMLMFAGPMKHILTRIVADEISAAWVKYLNFAIVVVGVSSGVRVYSLEKYITAPVYGEHPSIVKLTTERWVLELYRTVIETLQGIAWMLLVFFVIALVAYVVVRIAEMWSSRKMASSPSPSQ